MQKKTPFLCTIGWENMQDLRDVNIAGGKIDVYGVVHPIMLMIILIG